MLFGLFGKEKKPEIKKYKHTLSNRQTVFLLVKERMSKHYQLFLTPEKYQEWIDAIEKKTAKFIKKDTNGDVYGFKLNDKLIFVLYKERLITNVVQYNDECVKIYKGFK